MCVCVCTCVHHYNTVRRSISVMEEKGSLTVRFTLIKIYCFLQFKVLNPLSLYWVLRGVLGMWSSYTLHL